MINIKAIFISVGKRNIRFSAVAKTAPPAIINQTNGSVFFIQSDMPWFTLFALSISGAANTVCINTQNKIAKINRFFLENITTLKKVIRISIFGISVFSINLNIYAKDFGTQGHSFKIAEQGFLRMINERLQKVDMKKEQAKMTAIAKDRVENPQAVEQVKPATSSREFYYDPTYTLDQDAVLPCGKILHKAGTRVNPFEYMSLNRRLFFIDAREAAQIKWLKPQLANPLPEQQEPVQDRIILVGGSPLKLKEELGSEHSDKVYFDQGGMLSDKFGIKFSPAIALQEGLMVKINEVTFMK